MGVIGEQIVQPDGTLVDTASVARIEPTNGRGSTDFETLRK
jgi:hypothetical protein